MADRYPRRKTVIELAQPVEARSTEQMDVVMQAFGNTVTVTETAGGDPFALDDGSERRATLLVMGGPAQGQVFSLGKDTVIGRDQVADIVMEDSAVSRRHARFVDENGYRFIEDLASANGTFVNGTRVTRCELESGDRVQLGPRVVLRFSLLDEHELTMHRQLFESSTRDALTAAYNKKYITERLHAEVAHATRHKSALEIIVFDLDRFKLVNDTYGHLVGDMVLRAVADRVHSAIRSEDVYGRFGGEEFVVITRASNSARLAERIRVAVEQLAIPTDRGPLRVTLSLGVAHLDEVPDRSPAALLEKADLRLLVAKRTGRNRVCAQD